MALELRSPKDCTVVYDAIVRRFDIMKRTIGLNICLALIFLDGAQAGYVVFP